MAPPRTHVLVSFRLLLAEREASSGFASSVRDELELALQDTDLTGVTITVSGGSRSLPSLLVRCPVRTDDLLVASVAVVGHVRRAVDRAEARLGRRGGVVEESVGARWATEQEAVSASAVSG